MIISLVILTNTAQWLFIERQDAQRNIELAELKHNFVQISSQNEQLSEDKQRLSSELEETKQRLAMQMVTDKELQQQLDQLQSKLFDINRELTFYQDITQGNSTSELQIRDLQISQIAEQQYRYRLVLTQGKKTTRATKGSIKLSVRLSNNKAVALSDQSLNIKHVQVIEGIISLSDTVTPTAVDVRLISNKKTLSKRSFDWQLETMN
jgi:predicted nuclease with TOPRIM domain